MSETLDVLATRLRTPRAALRPDSRLREDLGADSLDLIVLACELEERFGIAVPDSALERTRTVADVARLVARRGPAGDA
ncbi:MAG: acyl carrier protein [Candidatus Rokubacteria bacterium]|nr:acyl carrier protein [Candidatus Rokubacteria bacterium]